MRSVDLRALQRKARETGDREAFETVDRRGSARIGVGVRLATSGPPRYFVEVVIDPSPGRPSTRRGQLGRAASLSERLRARGYRLRVEEDGCLSGERGCTAAQTRREVRVLETWLEEG